MKHQGIIITVLPSVTLGEKIVSFSLLTERKGTLFYFLVLRREVVWLNGKVREGGMH